MWLIEVTWFSNLCFSKTICLISSINVSNEKFEIASEKQKKQFLFCVLESKSWLSVWSKCFVHSDWYRYSNSNFQLVRGLTTNIKLSFASFKLFRRDFNWNIIVFHVFGIYFLCFLKELFSLKFWDSTGA